MFNTQKTQNPEDGSPQRKNETISTVTMTAIIYCTVVYVVVTEITPSLVT